MTRPGAAELVLIATLVLAPAAGARAQPDAALLDADLRAAELFDLGVERRRAGDLEGACAAFADSQALAAALGTQLNLAACLERQGRFEDARALLRATLDEATRRGDRSRADRARDELARLDAWLANLAAAPVPRPQPVAVAPAPQRLPDAPVTRSTRWHLALGLGAGALTAAGVALVYSGHAQQDAADAACPDLGQFGCDPAAAQASNDAAVLRSRLGVGMLVGGVVLAETALYLWWRGRQDRRERTPARHAGLVVAPGGGVLTYEGRFR